MQSFIAFLAMSGRYGAKMGLMPSGLKRFQRADALHFITFSCFHRLPLLEAPAARGIVEAVLEQTRARHQGRVYAYVLSPSMCTCWSTSRRGLYWRNS